MAAAVLAARTEPDKAARLAGKSPQTHIGERGRLHTAEAPCSRQSLLRFRPLADDASAQLEAALNADPSTL